MTKALFFVTLLLINNLVPFQGSSQSTITSQRLLLQTSFSYFSVVKDFQVSLDSSLIYCSRSLGLSRTLVIAEGFYENDLLKKSEWVDNRDPATALRLLPRLHGIPHLRLLVLLGAYYTFEPDAYHIYKDSVLYFLSKAIEESKTLDYPIWRRQALCLLGKFFVTGNDLKQGAAYFDQLTTECQLAGDIKNESKAWMYRGLYTPYSSGTTTKDRIFYLEKALDLYRRQKQPEGEINAWMDIGYLWISNLQMAKGESAFRQALALEDSIRFPYTHYTTNAIAMATLYEGKYGEPLKYALQTVQTAEAVRDSIGWAYFYNRVGTLYSYQTNRRAECLQWMEKSLDRFIRIGGDPSLYRNLGNITALMAEDGRAAEALARAQRIGKLYPPSGPADRLYFHLMLGDCYKNLKQYELAEKNYLEAGRLEKETEGMHGNFSRAYIDARIGSFYFAAGRYPSAKKYFRQFLSDPSHLNVPLTLNMDVHKMMFVMDSASGQTTTAIQHLQEYLHLVDSNFSISEGRQVEELGLQYETVKKENDIRIKDQHIQSLIQADLLRQASLKHADLIKNITVAGIGVLLILGGLFYRQYRQKQKANQAVMLSNAVITQANEDITRKNELLERLLSEKDWLLKEVHHRVKNNLHTIFCLLESQASFLENDALQAIENSQNRIYAMSLVHQKLYQSNDIAAVDMSLFFSDFLHFLTESFGLADRIKIIQNVQAVKMSISRAIPFALILNEAVTNAIKYAFPDREYGKISVSLCQMGRQIQLIIADNGIGIKEVSQAEYHSLGIELMKGLSGEMDAEINFKNDNGTIITLTVQSELEIESGHLHKVMI